MRCRLGTLAAAAVACVTLALTAGCGSSSTAADPGSGPTSDQASESAGLPSLSPGVIEGAKVQPLLSMTGVGGRVQPAAAPLDSRADIAAFARQFHAPAVRQRIRAAVDHARARPGQRVVGQVIAVGCDRPPGAEVIVDQDGDVQLVPHEVASPLEECLVEVTTVAIAVLPAT